MSTDLQLSLDNLTQWAGHLQMRVEALETKVYGSPIDQPRKVITPEEAKLKPDCPGYTECKEMLINLQRENAEIKKLNHLITLDLDNELMESDVMVSIIKENEQMKAEIKRLQKIETKLINKLDLIYNTVVNSSRD